MIKKILISIFFIMIIAQSTFAEDIFRVTSVNFDTSNSLIFLSSPDNTTEAIMKNIKLSKLQNPKRVYFDINSAVLTTAPQNWFFKSSGVKQVKVSQFSTNPNKVRVVMHLDESFDQSKISFLKVNNNIVINFRDILSSKSSANTESYFQNTYRDEKSSSSDFYENLSISSAEIEKVKIAVNSLQKAPASATLSETKDIILNQIDQSFNSVQKSASSLKIASAKNSESIEKELKLKSKYYLDSVSAKTNGFLISGFGVVGIEKPMYLTNPTRVVFDIPNAIMNPDIKSQELKINQDSVKIGQYSQNKTRITITSSDLEKYFPIFSSDGQSVLFMKSEKVDIESLFSKTCDAISYHVKEIGPTTSEFIIAFNSPVVHSVRRDNSKLTINFYNALRYNEGDFTKTVASSDMEDMKIDLLPQVGLKLTLPIEKDNVVNCYLGADGKSVKIVVKRLKPKSHGYLDSVKNIVLPNCSGKKIVFLDPGHGGSDYGAIRAGINEKDITLDVSKRVEALLASRGVIVYMTRERDESVSLLDRTLQCASKSPNVFVSIHVNSSVKPEIVGIETHYYHQESLNFAQTVHASLVSYIKTKDRNLFKSKFYVINHTNVPAILIEIGFISNDAERAELVSEARKQQTAKAIAEGILKYLNKN